MSQRRVWVPLLPSFPPFLRPVTQVIKVNNSGQCELIFDGIPTTWKKEGRQLLCISSTEDDNGMTNCITNNKAKLHLALMYADSFVLTYTCYYTGANFRTMWTDTDGIPTTLKKDWSIYSAFRGLKVIMVWQILSRTQS